VSEPWRVVLDTMVWAQAATAQNSGHLSAPSEIVMRAIAGEYTLVASPYIRAEVTRVLREPQFSKRVAPLFDPEGWFDAVMEKHMMVEVSGSAILGDHSKDDPILWAAYAGMASHLVTREKRLLDLKAFHFTQIFAPPGFLREWRVPKVSEHLSGWKSAMRQARRR